MKEPVINNKKLLISNVLKEQKIYNNNKQSTVIHEKPKISNKNSEQKIIINEKPKINILNDNLKESKTNNNNILNEQSETINNSEE